MLLHTSLILMFWTWLIAVRYEPRLRSAAWRIAQTKSLVALCRDNQGSSGFLRVVSSWLWFHSWHSSIFHHLQWAGRTRWTEDQLWTITGSASVGRGVALCWLLSANTAERLFRLREGTMPTWHLPIRRLEMATASRSSYQYACRRLLLPLRATRSTRTSMPLRSVVLSTPVSDQKSPLCTHTHCPAFLVYSVVQEVWPRFDIRVLLPQMLNSWLSLLVKWLAPY